MDIDTDRGDHDARSGLVGGVDFSEEVFCITERHLSKRVLARETVHTGCERRLVFAQESH